MFAYAHGAGAALESAALPHNVGSGDVLVTGSHFAAGALDNDAKHSIVFE